MRWTKALLFSYLVARSHGQHDVKRYLDAHPHSIGTGPYQILGSKNIKDKVVSWESAYPDLVKVSTAQEAFDMPRAGNKDDCPFDDGVNGCSNYFITVQDFVAHPEGSESSAFLPEVFWSGSLHGDERVGPTVVIQAADLLLQAAACEARPNPLAQNRQDELAEARECRQMLKLLGINDQHRQWLARLVSTRRIVIVPTANALGFFRHEHGEGDELVDPDVDFPYDHDNPYMCMKTIAARTVNEVFRDHLFQVALSFHSGVGGIGYSWSTERLEGPQQSPDHQSQMKLAMAHSKELGGSSHKSNGPLSSLVGYRRGAFEDWAYAASWEFDRMGSCTPETFGGYAMERTEYSNSTNRAVALSVSAGGIASEYLAELGSASDVFQPDETGFLVSDNVRLALVSVDMVEPYLSILGVDSSAISDDIVPLSERTSGSCRVTGAVAVPFAKDTLIVEWTVGGSFDIEHSDLYYAKWDEVEEGELDCVLQPMNLTLDHRFKKARHVGEYSGHGQFSQDGSFPPPTKSSIKPGLPLGPVFRAEIDTVDYKENDQLVLVARARVDQDWQHEGLSGQTMAPQSHLANARTNPDWQYENGAKRIRGRLDWFSVPVTVVLRNFEDGSDSFELFDRFTADEIETPGDQSSSMPFLYLFVFLVLAVATLLGIGVLYWRHAHAARIQRILVLEQSGKEQVSYTEKQSNLYSDDYSEGGAEIIDFQDVRLPSEGIGRGVAADHELGPAFEEFYGAEEGFDEVDLAGVLS